MPRIENGVLMGQHGRIIADEVDIPSPHTRHYQDIEARIDAMSPQEAHEYTETLRRQAHRFDAQDTPGDARSQGRLVYRSWPQNANADQDMIGQPGKYVSGFSSLTTTQDPTALRQAQQDFRKGRQPDPFTSAPASLLGRNPDHPENLYSGGGPGMVTALQPELYYVQMEAIHRRAQLPDATPELRESNAALRAEVTHPHLFSNKDLSSMVVKMSDGTERRSKLSVASGNPASDFKLRENATRYQSYMAAHGHEQTEINNEMAVHYRSTGQSTPAIPMKMQQPTPQNALARLASIVKKPDPVPLPENPQRDTAALGSVLHTTHTYPVLK